MPEGATRRCLVFTEERGETTEALAALLGECDLSATLCAGPQEWRSLLGVQRWHTLVIDASRESRCGMSLVTPVRQYALRTLLCRSTDGGGRDLRARLTPVEQTVLHHVLSSRTNRQIANLLNRSPRTIEVHRRHIMEKVGAANLVELVRKTIDTGIIHSGQRWP